MSPCAALSLSPVRGCWSLQPTIAAPVRSAPPERVLIKSRRFIGVFSVLRLDFFVYFVSFDIDSGEGSCGAYILTLAASDTFLLVHGGHFALFGLNHHDGVHRAVSCAVAAADMVGEDDAVLFDPHGVSYLCVEFLLLCYGVDSVGGAYISASCAVGGAVAAFVRHLRLHEMKEVVSGSEHLVRAGGDA